MGKIYDLLIEPFVNIVDKTRSQRETAMKEHRQSIDVLEDSRSNNVTSRLDKAPSSEELQHRGEEEDCVTCKIVAISTLMMYGTAIILVPTTQKYRQNMKKYLANKNYVLLIFAVHSFVGCGCFAGAFYQGLKLKEVLDRRKNVEK